MLDIPLIRLSAFGVHGWIEQTRNHTARAPIPLELIQFLGAQLKAPDSKFCTYSSNTRPVQWVDVVMPEGANAELGAFLAMGVYSAPCACYSRCKKWLFLRTADFDNYNENMRPHLEAVGWRKTKGIRPYFYLCPMCNTENSDPIRMVHPV